MIFRLWVWKPFFLFPFNGFPGFTAEPEMGSLVSNLAWTTNLTLPPGRRLTDNPKRMIGPGVAALVYTAQCHIADFYSSHSRTRDPRTINSNCSWFIWFFQGFDTWELNNGCGCFSSPVWTNIILEHISDPSHWVGELCVTRIKCESNVTPLYFLLFFVTTSSSSSLVVVSIKTVWTINQENQIKIWWCFWWSDWSWWWWWKIITWAWSIYRNCIQFSFGDNCKLSSDVDA